MGDEQAGVLTVEAVEAMPLRDFAKSNLVVHVDSAVVGERVLFVGDEYVAAQGDPIAYQARELAALIGVDPHVVRLAHAVKRGFPGARVASTAWKREE
jgi:hypothetical protein